MRDVAKTVLDVDKANKAAKRSMINFPLHFLYYLATRGSDSERRRRS